MKPEITPDMRVMEYTSRGGYDVGSDAEGYFGDDLPRLEIGEAQGRDDQRGAYDWWPLSLNGKQFGELRDDAGGLTIHVTNEPHDLLEIP
jgi:hypothetical protein